MRDEFLTSDASDADVGTDMQPQPALDPAITLAEYAASAAREPEPVGRTLRVLVERVFTGEVEFELGTGVLVYTDGGYPYYAERIGDAPLGDRLVTTGVMTAEQLARGITRVGDVEHLGRLFDRDPSIDRDAVLAATELGTDELLTEIASQVARFELTPYRHHRSGLHRWFVGPDRVAPLRPVQGVSQLDRSVFDRMPDVGTGRPPDRSLPAPNLGAASAGVDRPLESLGRGASEPDLRIEWAEPDLDFAPAELDDDQFDPLAVEVNESPDATASTPTVEERDRGDVDDETHQSFTIVWPDGSEQPTAETDGPPKAAPRMQPDATPPGERDVVRRGLSDRPADVVTGFAFPPLRERGEQLAPPTDADAVPDEVADAVRRALAAIERASADPSTSPKLRVDPVDLPDVAMPKLLDPEASPVAGGSAEIEPPGTRAGADESTPSNESPPGGLAPPVRSAFAPPTPDMAAEAVYARAAAELERTHPVDVAPSDEAGTGLPDDAPGARSEPPGGGAIGDDVDDRTEGEALPEPGQASIVFLDDEEAQEERKGALRRLIGSLRRR